MKKSIRNAAMMMMAAAMMGTGNEYFDTGRHRARHDPYERETEEERRQRLRKMYGQNRQEHEFVIKGERIMARDKRTAMKIYANRHPDTGGKKRKKR